MQTLWTPQPKQEIALARIEDEVLYGGARGGGKTDAGMAWLLYDIDKPRYRALVIRRNAEDLKDWSDRAKWMFRGTSAEFTGNPPDIKFPSGAIIRTGHLKDENAYIKYQGHEYQKILIEELSHIPREKDYIRLVGSCRSTVPNIQPQIFATTNPDDPGYEWIKARWGIPDMPNFDKVYSNKTLEGKTLVFIPAKLEDNPILMNADPNYLKYLESLKTIDRELYEAWRNGNWKGFGIEGAYYRQQVSKAEEEERITDVPYEEQLKVYTWCDLGIRDSFVIGYFQIHGMQWRVIDYDEFEGESLGSAIDRMNSKPWKNRYERHYAPHDIAIRELGTGKSRLELAESLGVNYEIVSDLHVQEGINALRMRFNTLWFDRTKCDLLLKRLRRYHKEFDEKRGVYKAIPAHDINSHAADMMRYWAVTDFDIGGIAESYKPSWDGY